MIVELPMNFQLTWLFIFMYVHWTSTLHCILFTKDMSYNSDVTFDNSWHNLTWHCWHWLACWGGRSRCCYCWVIDVLLDVLSRLLHVAWWCRVFNDLWSLKVVACMWSLFLFLISFFVHLVVSESSSMFSPSSFTSSSHHNLTVYLCLQFTHLGLTNPKKYTNLSS